MIFERVAELRQCADDPADGITYFPCTPERRSLPLPPRFVFGDFPSRTSARYFGETGEWETGLYVARDVEVFGPHLLARGTTVFACTELHMSAEHVPFHLREFAALHTPRRVREVAGTAVHLISPGYDVYGHWLVDILPRIGLLQHMGFDLAGMTFLLPDDAPAYGVDWLGMLGLPPHGILRYDRFFDRVHAEQLLMPTVLRTNSRVTAAFAPAIEAIRGLIEAHAGAAAGPREETPPRLFVSRARANRRKRELINRDAVETIARAAGFTIVHPERHPLPEQFRLFAGARQILGEYGSAMHASMFAAPGTVVGALLGDNSPITGFLQSAIGQAMGHPTGYVFGPTEEGTLERFTVAEDDLRRCLDWVFGAMALQ